MKYTWVEMDPDGNTQSLNVTLPGSQVEVNGVKYSTPSTTVSRTKKLSSDELGESLVYYCFNSVWPGHIYSTGTVYFRLYE